MITIRTDRLVIRNFRTDDWQDLHEMIVKYQASEYAIYDHKWPTDAEEIKGVTAWFAGGDRFLAVCLQTTGKLIGFVSLNPQEEENIGEYDLGYVFHADYQGRGYATESCRAILDYAFTGLRADRVVSGTAAVNTPSCRLLGRLGLQEISQNTVAFHKTPDGKPIEFVALSFAISKEVWSALDQIRLDQASTAGG